MRQQLSNKLSRLSRTTRLVASIISALLLITLAIVIYPNQVRADAQIESALTRLSYESSSDGFTYETNSDGSLTITGYTGTETCIAIPSSIGGASVTTIGEYAFSNLTTLTSAIIPEGVISIEKGAFVHCHSLTEVSIPTTVTSIGASAFVYCSSITSIAIPNGVTSIQDGTFSDCYSLTDVSIPNSVTSIGNSAFANCLSLEVVVLPDSVTSIGDSAFNYCTSLSSVEVSERLSTIGQWSFEFCGSLESIELPGTVTSIGTEAFASCNTLESVTILSNNISIADDAFFETDAKIYGASNSDAIQFAIDNGLQYEIIVPPVPAPGDIPPATGNTVNRSAAEAFVTRCYELVLGRSPDQTGLNNWVNSLVNNQNTGAHMAYGFFFSQEYINSNTTNEQYVTTLYNVFLDRQPDAAGLADWVGQLERGATREQIFAGVANSREFFALCNTYGITAGHYIQGIDNTRQQNVNAFVARLYSMCLGRNGDYDGQASWVRQLINGENSGAGVGYGFFFSPEFINRNLTNEEYTATLYRVFLGREPDQAGFNDWVSQLNGGADRLSIFRGFAHSQEYTNICTSYGIVRGTI